MNTNQEQVQKSMSIIVQEIQMLFSDLQQLRKFYDVVADASDLTFIRILKDKYELLEEDFIKLSGVVTEVQIEFVHSAQESQSFRKII